MEINQIREYIQAVLTDLAGHSVNDTTQETQLIFDTNGDNYMYLRHDWREFMRRYDVYVHIEIRNGFVWVQRDNTDYGVVDELEKRGIPKNKIVLGFHPPYKRPYTGYATGEPSSPS